MIREEGKMKRAPFEIIVEVFLDVAAVAAAAVVVYICMTGAV